MSMTSTYGVGSSAPTSVPGVGFATADSDTNRSNNMVRDGGVCRGDAATFLPFPLDGNISANSVMAVLIELETKTSSAIARQTMEAGAENAISQVLVQVENAVDQLKSAVQICNDAITAAKQQRDATVDTAIQDLITGIAQVAAFASMVVLTLKCNLDIAQLKLSKSDDATDANGVKVAVKTQTQVEAEEEKIMRDADRIWQKTNSHIQTISVGVQALSDLTKSGGGFYAAKYNLNAATTTAMKDYLTSMMNTMAQECNNMIQLLEKIAGSFQNMVNGIQNSEQQTTSSGIQDLR